MWDNVGYPVINPDSVKELLVRDKNGLTPIHHAIASGNASFISAVCASEKPSEDILINWDAPSLQLEKLSLLDFAIDAYNRYEMENNEICMSFIRDIVQMLIAAHPALTQRMSRPIPEGLSFITNPGKIRVWGMIQRTRAIYLQKNLGFLLPTTATR